jgi:hypothetical protein
MGIFEGIQANYYSMSHQLAHNGNSAMNFDEKQLWIDL